MRSGPWSSPMSAFAIASPRPEPWWLLVSWLSTCSNGRPSRASASSGMPIPVSAIEMLTQPLVARARIVTRPPSGGNLPAMGQQVHPVRVGRGMVGGQTEAAAEPGGELEPFVVGASGPPPHRVIEEGLELDLLGVEPDASRLDLRHVEDIVDHFEQV